MALSNDPPDVELRLTHEQATFMLENCRANVALCTALVMGIADEKCSIAKKREKAERIVELQDKFQEIRTLLRRAGAREKED